MTSFTVVIVKPTALMEEMVFPVKEELLMVRLESKSVMTAGRVVGSSVLLEVDNGTCMLENTVLVM